MATTDPKDKLLPLHDLANVNTVIGMLYDENGNYRAAFEPSKFYDTILWDSLKYGEENFVHLKYAETLSIRKGEKVARFRRWAGLTPTLAPLKEGVPPSPDKHAYETIEVGNVFSFGRWSEYTDQVNLSIVNEVLAERSVQYGELANQTKELYARKTWLSSPNEFYANFKDFGTLQFGDEVTLDDLRFLIARMKRMMVKPVGGKFLYICSAEFINSLIDDPRVKQYMAIEQTTGKLWSSGEPFDLFELSFIPTMLDEFAYPDTEYPGVYELSNGHEAIRLYALKDDTIYYLDMRHDFVVKDPIKARVVAQGLTYLKDGTAIDNHAKWELPTDATALAALTVQASGDPTATKVTLRKSTRTLAVVDGVRGYTYSALADATGSTDLAAVNTLIAAGAFMQLPVHRGILFGAEAMLKLNVEGVSDAPRIIIKSLGSSGVTDPMDQRQSIAFRVDGFGLAIKRPEAICVTYSIPKFAELAALSSKMVSGGEWVFMDERSLDDTKANHIRNDGAQALRVDGVNLGGVPGEDLVDGADTYPSVLHANPLDTDGNDPESNVK